MRKHELKHKTYIRKLREWGNSNSGKNPLLLSFVIPEHLVNYAYKYFLAIPIWWREGSEEEPRYYKIREGEERREKP